jgi:arginase
MKVAVIGVPSAWGSPHPGVIETPEYLRAARLLDWLQEAGLDVRDRGDVPVLEGWQPPAARGRGADDEPHLPHLAEVVAVQRAVREAVEEVMDAGELPLLIGGECGIGPGAIAAVAGTGAGGAECAETSAPATGPLVVWLDAHGDLNTPESSPSGLLCGMPLAVALGRGHPRALAVGADISPVRPEDIWLIGARDLDAGELATLAELPIHHVSVGELRTLGAEQLTEKILPGVPILPPEARARGAQRQPTREADRARAAVYLHIDIDCIDPSEAPGVTFPVDGGLGAAEVADLAGYLCASGCLAALTIASASLPEDEGGRTLESVRRLVVSIADALSLAA